MDSGTEHGRNERKQFGSTALIVAALMFGAFVIGTHVGARDGSPASASFSFLGLGNGISSDMPEELDFDAFWRAWNTLEKKYVPASTTAPVISDEERMWGAIRGLADSFDDPYTVFLPPEEASMFEEDISGNFEGVGMEVGIRDGITTVIAPLKDTPAYHAGIQSGDKILRIDEQATDGMSLNRAIMLIRGEKGTEVSLLIARDGEDEFLEIGVVRDVIAVPTIETEVRLGENGEVAGGGSGLREDGVFVIRLFNFSAVSPHLFRNSLREFINSGSDKLVLDLRGNPGGFLEAAVDMASWFLPLGKVIVREDFGNADINGTEPRVHRSKGYDVFDDDLKMVVLIDQGSASASEILAGALSEHGVATLVGAQTFGKGSVQELVDITDDTSLKVTIARWLTPKGASISDGGVSPDVPVEFTLEDFEAGRDPQLEKAIEVAVDSL